MIKEFEDKTLNEKDLKDFNDQCEECKKKDESVYQNLILKFISLLHAGRVIEK